MGRVLREVVEVLVLLGSLMVVGEGGEEGSTSEADAGTLTTLVGRSSLYDRGRQGRRKKR